MRSQIWKFPLEMADVHRLVLIIALLVGGLIIALPVGGQEALAQINILSAIEKFRQAQPSRAAVHAAVKAYLKANVNDPRRLEIVSISKRRVSTDKAYKWMGGRTRRDWKPLGVVQKGFWEPIGRKGWAVAVRFRATNRLGALVLADKVFCISGGVVFDWMNLGDFHPTRPKRRSDPLTDAFMKLAR